MPLGTEVGLSPGDRVVLDGDPAPSQKGDRALSPIFGPFLLWPNGWMHQDATWYGARPQPMGLCVRWGPSPLPKKGAQTPPNFRQILLCQTAGCRPQPTWLCVRWGPSYPPEQRAHPPPLSFWPMFIVAKRLNGWRRHFVRK